MANNPIDLEQRIRERPRNGLDIIQKYEHLIEVPSKSTYVAKRAALGALVGAVGGPLMAGGVGMLALFGSAMLCLPSFDDPDASLPGFCHEPIPLVDNFDDSQTAGYFLAGCAVVGAVAGAVVLGRKASKKYDAFFGEKKKELDQQFHKEHDSLFERMIKEKSEAQSYSISSLPMFKSLNPRYQAAFLLDGLMFYTEGRGEINKFEKALSSIEQDINPMFSQVLQRYISNCFENMSPEVLYRNFKIRSRKDEAAHDRVMQYLIGSGQFKEAEYFMFRDAPTWGGKLAEAYEIKGDLDNAKRWYQRLGDSRKLDALEPERITKRDLNTFIGSQNPQ